MVCPQLNDVYYNYRYYSTELGRWLSRDPINQIGSPSWFANNKQRVELKRRLKKINRLIDICYRLLSKSPSSLSPQIVEVISGLKEVALFIQYEIQLDLLGKRNNSNDDNPYNHTGNNPINNTDRYGNWWGPALFVVAVIVVTVIIIDAITNDDTAEEAVDNADTLNNLDNSILPDDDIIPDEVSDAADALDWIDIVTEEDETDQRLKCAEKCTSAFWPGDINPAKLMREKVLPAIGKGGTKTK